MHAESLSWLVEFDALHPDKIERLRDQRIGWLAGYTSPRLDASGLRLANDWIMWLFALDDGYCDESTHGKDPGYMARMVGGLSCILDNPNSPAPRAGRCAEALRDVRLRVAERASRPQLHRWTCAVRDYLFGVVWEAANRQYGQVPQIHDYIAMREHASGIHTLFNALDLNGGYEVPTPLWHHLDLIRLRRLAGYLVAWDNDLYSYRKELADMGAMNNMITVLAHHHDISLEQAVEKLTDRHNKAVDEFGAVQERFQAAHPHPSVRIYIDNLETWVSGNIAFSFESTRYVQDM
ncbi:terpene synthase family protein [Streptomyces wuyuanensis]|uniref:terpene synthase family protein n=1 Tax=Streptomyces wuyuanensis TaxID=1196353 RepID=UPI003432A043